MCFLVFGAATLAGGTTQTMVMLRFGADYSPLVRSGEWWRLYGSTFLHLGLLHVGVDMFALWQVGPTCERLYGNLRYLALYSAAGLCGALASAHFSTAPAAGASGAIFGLLGAFVVLGWRWREELPPRLAHRFVRAMLPVIGYNLLFGFGFNGLSNGNVLIDNAAHLGGLVGGMAFAFLVPPAVSRRRLAPAGVLVPLLVLLAAAPFATEAVTAYHAARWSGVAGMPTAAYRDPEGRFALRYPVLLDAQVEKGSTVLAGPGMAVEVDVFEGIPIRALREEALRPVVRKLGMKSVDAVRREGGWLIFQGGLDGSQKGEFGFRIVKRRLFRMLVLSEDADFGQALQVAAGIRNTFQP